VGSWYCKRSERYGGRPVCKALKVKVASLNRIRHSIRSQCRCLRSSFEDSGDVRYCWYKTTRAAARWIRWRRAVCLSAMPYRIEFNWSRREEVSADATETAVLLSNDERICLTEQIMIKTGAWEALIWGVRVRLASSVALRILILSDSGMTAPATLRDLSPDRDLSLVMCRTEWLMIYLD